MADNKLDQVFDNVSFGNDTREISWDFSQFNHSSEISNIYI
jgi:hypothetical protein